jgi:histidine triad (HIT) family protein
MNTKDFYCDFVLNNKLFVVKEFETDNVLTFRHTKPSWTFHIVLVPKKHIAKIIDVNDTSIFSEIFSILKDLILKYNLDDSNYRIITNGGDFQDSKHLHFHLISGSKIVS